jgi:hypothetical protein
MKRIRNSAAAPTLGRYLQRYKPPLVGSTPGTGFMRPSVDMAMAALPRWRLLWRTIVVEGRI